MLGLSTGRYTIIRGTTSTDEYGDEVTSEEPLYEAVQGSVSERRRTSYNPVDSRVSTFRELVGRFGYGTDIQDGDRIKDEATGTVYYVDSVYHGSNFAMKSDVVVDLTTSK